VCRRTLPGPKSQDLAWLHSSRRENCFGSSPARVAGAGGNGVGADRRGSGAGILNSGRADSGPFCCGKALTEDRRPCQPDSNLTGEARLTADGRGAVAGVPTAAGRPNWGGRQVLHQLRGTSAGRELLAQLWEKPPRITAPLRAWPDASIGGETAANGKQAGCAGTGQRFWVLPPDTKTGLRRRATGLGLGTLQWLLPFAAGCRLEREAVLIAARSRNSFIGAGAVGRAP